MEKKFLIFNPHKEEVKTTDIFFAPQCTMDIYQLVFINIFFLHHSILFLNSYTTV